MTFLFTRGFEGRAPVLRGEVRWRAISERAATTLFVVVPPPALDLALRVRHIDEVFLVETSRFASSTCIQRHLPSTLLLGGFRLVMPSSGYRGFHRHHFHLAARPDRPG
jgi:hypothetical protein